MSGPSPVVADAVFLRPWQKVGLWIIVGLVIAGILVLFSGRMSFFHREQAKAQPSNVQMDTNIAPLNKPPIALAAAVPPRPAYVQQQNRPPPGVTDDDRAAALNSNIGIYQARNAGSTASAGGVDANGRPVPGSPDALEASLQPTTMDGTRVAELPDPRWLIEQGRVLPCIQQTKINSTLPGAVTAIIPEEIRGETKDVVLFDKGAKVFGTIQHTLMNGADRLAVLWQNITTPVLYDARGMAHQYRIAVNSPAASDLGETGLDGDVNRHLLIKIGGILGFSLVQGGIQAGIGELSKSSGGNNTTLNLNSVQTGTDQATSTLLNQWVTIPDVMTRDQALHCSIFVVRDLDMRAAYKLRNQYRSHP
jgi:type IV secretion system protein VirB10